MCIKLKQGNAQELRKILIEKESIGLIAVNDNILRIAYSAIGKEDLNVIFEKIHAYLNEFWIKRYPLGVITKGKVYK